MSNIKYFIYPPTGIEHYGEIIDSKDNFDVIECKTCGFKHVIPIPTEKEIEQYYKDTYYNNIKQNYIEKQHKEIEWWNFIYNERYAMFEKYLSKKQRRILDIGCGPGFFLKFGKERNWKGFGIEPSIKAALFAQSLGLEVINEFFNKTNYKNLGKFDVIQLNQVLEHLPVPKETITLCHRLLNPGGLLFISVANEYNPFQRIVTGYMDYPHWWVVPPQHINYFSIKTIKKLSKSCGFENVNLITTFPIDIFLLMGDNYIDNDSLGKICHKRRKNFEFALVRSGNIILKQKIYKALSKLNLGREIEILARKLI